ncbi:MAG: YaeQ family protein [Chromatiales bacterium]|nr:YaeQ family protein [Chromatiales bacterium]
MADKSTIYRGKIGLADSDQGRFETLELTVAQHPSETRERVIARILAYALCYQEDLQLGKGVCDGEMPDIYLQPPGEKMQRWIEVGEPTPERLQAACRKADQVILFLYGKRPWRWQEQHLQKLADYKNLIITLLPGELLQPLSEQLQRSFHWSLNISDNQAYLYPEGLNETLPAVNLGDLKQ